MKKQKKTEIKHTKDSSKRESVGLEMNSFDIKKS
jgi:hypothetical protein